MIHIEPKVMLEAVRAALATQARENHVMLEVPNDFVYLSDKPDVLEVVAQQIAQAVAAAGKESGEQFRLDELDAQGERNEVEAVLSGAGIPRAKDGRGMTMPERVSMLAREGGLEVAIRSKQLSHVAFAIVEDIRKDFTDRRGLRQEWDGIDAIIRQEILAAWRQAAEDRLAASRTMKAQWPAQRSDKPVGKEFTCGASIDNPGRTATHWLRLRWDPTKTIPVQCPAEGMPDEAPYWVDFEVYEIKAILSTGELEFDDGKDGFAKAIDDAIPIVHGFVKWDGCTQIWVPELAEPLHWDEQSGIEDAARAIVEVRRYAIVDVMKRYPEEI
jgi:hypothetical protein